MFAATNMMFAKSGLDLDPDAAAYILAVEAVDGQSLETGVKLAYDTFIRGCKDDSIWTAIKACCILAGARSLSGALVPLVGPAPTNNNFVAGDYLRKTGLKGNAANKWLNSNFAHSATAQNNVHAAVWASENYSVGVRFNIRCLSGSMTAIGRDIQSQPDTWVAHDAGSGVPRFTDSGTGFKAVTRSNSTNFVRRSNGTAATVTRGAGASAPGALPFGVFGDYLGSFPSDARLGLYSLGDALNLALLYSRVATLMSDINTAIP